MKIIIRKKEEWQDCNGRPITYEKEWDNLDNPFNLNKICFSLGVDSSLLSNPADRSRKGNHIALYRVYESPETGVIFRLGVYKYQFELLGWGADGFEDCVKYQESNQFRTLLQDVMKTLGFTYSEYPSPTESVALIERLCELDSEFCNLFNSLFEIEEISDDIHTIALNDWDRMEKRCRLNREIQGKDKEILSLVNKLGETEKHLQRVLIDCHFEECVNHVQESEHIDENYLSRKKEYEDAINNSMFPKKQLAILQNLFDGARLKYNNHHDKCISQIFGNDASSIDYIFLKSYVPSKISK